MKPFIAGVLALGVLQLGLVIASPAAAIGFQEVVTFDDLALGTTDFDDDFFPDHISGGTVVSATADYPAFSGGQLYGGTAIAGIVYDVVDFDWPAIGGYVTGVGTITLNTFIYDPVLQVELPTGSYSVSGSTPNMFLSSGTSGPATRWEFVSDQYFTLDDMTLGLPDVPPGIPEPASWALMIAGFGVVGVVLRRRLTPA